MDFDTLKKVLLTPVDALDIPERTKTALRNVSIEYVLQLHAHYDIRFLSEPNVRMPLQRWIPQLGDKTVNDISKALHDLGVPFGSVQLRDMDDLTRESRSRDSISYKRFSRDELDRFLSPEAVQFVQLTNAEIKNFDANAMAVVENLFPENLSKKLKTPFVAAVKQEIAGDEVFRAQASSLEACVHEVLSENILAWVDEKASQPIETGKESALKAEQKLLQHFIPKEMLSNLDTAFKNAVCAKLSADKDVAAKIGALGQAVEERAKREFIKLLGL